MAADGQYDVVWREGSLGLRFTPNERDMPVICQVPDSACAAVLASPVAVGDVLVAFRLQSDAETEMQPVTTFTQLVTVLRCAALPVTLRFQSREKEIPKRVEDAEAERTYVFTWAERQPLGVSLAMDPCSLHAAITAIDPRKISPAFQRLEPVVGDVLVAISMDSDANENTTRLDEMRFEDVIQTLRQFPRPSRLTFARPVAEDSDGSSEPEEDGVLFPLKPTPATRTATPPSSSDKAAGVVATANPAFLMRPMQTRPKSRSRAGLARARRPMAPISKRQSFRIDAPKTVSPPPAPSSGGRPHAGSGADDKSGFYTVQYSGGSVGLQLRDCSQDDKQLMNSQDKTNRTNGYSVAVKGVTNAQSAPGLDQASAGDLLMAIGQKDLQYMGFEQVRRELAAVRAPTTLLFKKRKRITANSTGASLVDTLMLFLV